VSDSPNRGQADDDTRSMTPPDIARFLALVARNQVVAEVLRRTEALNLPDWYLAAGCLYQSVWNVLDQQQPERGITDYDLIYFDDSDLSWEAEDQVIQRCADVFDDLPIVVEIRNQARVHVWYEDHFGVAAPPLRSSASADAIDRYAAHACQVAIRSRKDRYDVYAPHGFDDLFAFVLRPNPIVAPRHAYETKAARWQILWPRLRVLPWPEETGAELTSENSAHRRSLHPRATA